MRSTQSQPESPPWRRLWRIFRFFAILYLSILLLMMFLENKLIFPASKFPTGDWPAAERCGLTDAWFESSDGTRLHGWIAEHAAPRGVLLFCHGNAGNITNRADVVTYFRDHLRLTAFVFDYRGYGRSEGSPNEAGVLADARAARNWLAKHTGVAAGELVLMGRSLGGAVAVDLAADGGAKALILESTFTSAPDAGAAIYPWLPVRWIMKTRFDALSKITNYSGPLLMSHSTGDEIIPFELGQRLFEAAEGDKQFVTIDDAYHNDWQSPAYYAELEAFLDRVLE
jgi:hypothetical protein